MTRSEARRPPSRICWESHRAAGLPADLSQPQEAYHSDLLEPQLSARYAGAGGQARSRPGLPRPQNQDPPLGGPRRAGACDLRGRAQRLSRMGRCKPFLGICCADLALRHETGRDPRLFRIGIAAAQHGGVSAIEGQSAAAPGGALGPGRSMLAAREGSWTPTSAPAPRSGAPFLAKTLFRRCTRFRSGTRAVAGRA